MSRDFTQGAIRDADIEAILDWIMGLSEDRSDLERRMARARRYYLSNSYPKGRWWPDTSSLIPADDEIAGLLAQAEAMLTCKRAYDTYLGSCVVPFLKAMGMSIDALKKVDGVDVRVQRLLRATSTHPHGGLFELVTATRYARAGFAVNFIPESQHKTADFEVTGNGVPNGLMVECKRLRPSDYESRETLLIGEQNAAIARLIAELGASVHVDVEYVSELEKVPKAHIANKLQVSHLLDLTHKTEGSWKDEFASVKVRPANMSALREDLQTTYLRNDTKMARLLTGSYQPEGCYLTCLSARPSREDPRHVDKLSQASIITWHSSSDESIVARSRHIRSVIGKVDKQLAASKYGIAHIGMESEKDTLTADLRRAKNVLEVATFFPASALEEVHMHYFLPRAAEMGAWTIDETIDSRSKSRERILADARVLRSNEIDIDNDVAAWHLPPPEPYNLTS